jgi:hypothetical protein
MTARNEMSKIDQLSVAIRAEAKKLGLIVVSSADVAAIVWPSDEVAHNPIYLFAVSEPEDK